MEAQSIFLKNEAKGESGDVEPKGDQYRARVQYRDDDGNRKAVRGPVRHNKQQAQADLEAITKSAASKMLRGASAAPTISRAELFEAMQTGAHSLQQFAPCEAKVAMMVNKKKSNRQHMRTESETEPEIDPIHDLTRRTEGRRCILVPPPTASSQSF